jgi:tRNA splicing ligase
MKGGVIMNNKNMFLTLEELAVTISALETFGEAKNADIQGYVLREELKQSLIKSSVQKLKFPSAFSYFNKQEYTVMHMALVYILKISAFANVDFDLTAVISASEKTLSLAGPS